MSRLITQQTFDDAVKENIEEFSMSTTEAVESAIQEFESQVIPYLITVSRLLYCLFMRKLFSSGCQFAKYHH